MDQNLSAAPIAIDTMGGDLGPAEMIEGVALAIHKLQPDVRFLLFGDEPTLEPLLTKAKLANNARLSIQHTTQVIGMDEKPIESIKKKRDSSMVRAIESVNEKRAKAVLSCGNTGSLMACSTLKLRPLEGLERPSIATIIPTPEQHFVLLDAGANPEFSPINFVHNAILGTYYAKVVLNIEKPQVGLLSIGTEEGKGTELIHRAHEMLKKIDDLIDYNGLIEGFQVFTNHVDVILCDGFVGNIVLKVSESIAIRLKEFIKEEIVKTPLRKVGAFLSRGAFKSIKNRLNPDCYGGAPLLGLAGNVMKAHGSSSRNAIMHAIRITLKIADQNYDAKMIQLIKEANLRIN